MKVWLAVGTLILFSCMSLQAQSGVKKFPGDAITFSVTYAVADEPNTTGFKLYSGTSASGPFTFTGTTVTPSSLRSFVVPAAFPVGNVYAFYTLRAYFTTAQGTVESVDSNVVEVDMNVRTPGFQAN